VNGLYRGRHATAYYVASAVVVVLCALLLLAGCGGDDDGGIDMIVPPPPVVVAPGSARLTTDRDYDPSIIGEWSTQVDPSNQRELRCLAGWEQRGEGRGGPFLWCYEPNPPTKETP